MKFSLHRIKSGLQSLGLAIGLLWSPAVLGQDDVSLIRSHIGSYQGVGVVLYETGAYEAVNCRIRFEPGAAGRIILRDATCNVSGTAIRLNGTLAYTGHQYEAAVTSNIGFSASTIGRREGNSLVFQLEDGKLIDQNLGLKATLLLTPDGIVIDMDIISNLTGAVTQARVPLSAS